MSLEEIKSFLEQNSVLFIILFGLSVVANLFEIAGFIRERRGKKVEEKRRKEEEKRLKVYEFLFETAEKSLSTEEELNELKLEVSKRKNLIPTLEKRIHILSLAAKKEITKQNIDRVIGELRSSQEQLNKLLQLRAELGDLPDLPKSEMALIQDSISQSTHLPFELPKSIAFRSLLLVLILLLLPSPADQILVVVLLSMFLGTFFEVTAFSDEPKMKNWVFKHYRSIGFISCFGAWYFMIRSIDTLLGRPTSILFDFVSDFLRNSDILIDSSPIIEFFIRRSYTFSEFAIIFLAMVLARIHWTKIRIEIEELLNKHIKTK